MRVVNGVRVCPACEHAAHDDFCRARMPADALVPHAYQCGCEVGPDGDHCEAAKKRDRDAVITMADTWYAAEVENRRRERGRR